MVINMETKMELVEFIMMDLNDARLKRATKELGINPVEVYTKDHDDFLNKEFLEMLHNEYGFIKTALQQQMEYESTLPEYQMYGHYIPSDLWFEAEITLNTLMATMFDLMELL